MIIELDYKVQWKWSSCDFVGSEIGELIIPEEFKFHWGLPVFNALIELS